jgi:hypothetical protein
MRLCLLRQGSGMIGLMRCKVWGKQKGVASLLYNLNLQ